MGRKCQASKRARKFRKQARFAKLRDIAHPTHCNSTTRFVQNAENNGKKRIIKQLNEGHKKV